MAAGAQHEPLPTHESMAPSEYAAPQAPLAARPPNAVAKAPPAALLEVEQRAASYLHGNPNEARRETHWSPGQAASSSAKAPPPPRPPTPPEWGANGPRGADIPDSDAEELPQSYFDQRSATASQIHPPVNQPQALPLPPAPPGAPSKAPPMRFQAMLHRRGTAPTATEGHARGLAPQAHTAEAWLDPPAVMTMEDLRDHQAPSIKAPPPNSRPASEHPRGQDDTTGSAEPPPPRPATVKQPPAPPPRALGTMDSMATEEIVLQRPTVQNSPSTYTPSESAQPLPTRDLTVAQDPEETLSLAPSTLRVPARSAATEPTPTDWAGFDAHTAIQYIPQLPSYMLEVPPYVQMLGDTPPESLPRLTPAQHAAFQRAENIAQEGNHYWSEDPSIDHSNHLFAVEMTSDGVTYTGMTLIRFATYPAFIAECRDTRILPYAPYVVMPHPPQPWTLLQATAPPDAKDYMMTNPVWIAVKKEDLPSWTMRLDWDGTGPHPLALREQGTTVPFKDSYPNRNREDFGLPCRDHTELRRWTALNKAGMTPAGIYGWVLAEDAPRNEEGIRIHHEALGVYHPPLAKWRSDQPKPYAPLCKNFSRTGCCAQGRNCQNRHEELALPKAICAHYLKGENCRLGDAWDPAANPCDRIHGMNLNDPTGRDLLGWHTEGARYVPSLRVHHEMLPELLTDSPYPPASTFREKQRTPRPLWLPIPTPSTFHVYRFRMTDALYGVSPHSLNWVATAPPPCAEPIYESLEYAIIQLVEERNIPPEISKAMLEQYIHPMLHNLPRIVHAEYKEDHRAWVRDPAADNGGHYLSRRHRPVTAELAANMRVMASSLMRTIRSEMVHVDNKIERLE